MSPEVGDNREILAYFFVYVASPSPFNLLTQQASARSWAKGSASL